LVGSSPSPFVPSPLREGKQENKGRGKSILTFLWKRKEHKEKKGRETKKKIRRTFR